jgi:hypothetical protein
MPLKPDKSTIGVTVTAEFKERIKRLAEAKHWSVSQTVGLFIDAYWDTWEKELGVSSKTDTPKKSKR